jgi:hypothetical protein
MTITSKREGKSTTHLVPVFANREGKRTSIGTSSPSKKPSEQNLISHVDEWQTEVNKEEKFIKALFLCLFLGAYPHVDKYMQPNVGNAYRIS